MFNSLKTHKVKPMMWSMNTPRRVVFRLLCLAALSGAAWGSGLQSDLDAVVQSHASFWNVSLTMAFGFFDDDGRVYLFTCASPADTRLQMYTHVQEVQLPAGIGPPPRFA